MSDSRKEVNAHRNAWKLISFEGYFKTQDPPSNSKVCYSKVTFQLTCSAGPNKGIQSKQLFENGEVSPVFVINVISVKA